MQIKVLIGAGFGTVLSTENGFLKIYFSADELEVLDFPSMFTQASICLTIRTTGLQKSIISHGKTKTTLAPSEKNGNSDSRLGTRTDTPRKEKDSKWQ
jgi:hypothetical protein